MSFGQHIKHPIDLSTWEFGLRLSDKTVGVATSLAIKRAFEEWPPGLGFARSGSPDDGLGGPIPQDTTTLYLSLPLRPQDDNDHDPLAYWSFSLAEIVDEFIQGDTNVVNGVRAFRNDNNWKAADAAASIAAGLRALADKLDSLIER